MQKRLFCTLLIFLFSCAKVTFDRLDEMPHFALKESVENALQEPIFQEGNWPKKDWWTIFQDDQLSAVIVEGLSNSPTLQKALASAGAASDIAKQVRSSLFPHIQFKTSEEYEHLSKSGFERYYSVHPFPLPTEFAPVEQFFSMFEHPVPAVLNTLFSGFHMQWELDLFGKNQLKLMAALGSSKAARAEAEQVRLSLSAELAQSYLSLQLHMAVLDIQQQLVNLRKRAEHLSNLRTAIGVAPKESLIQSEINLEKMEDLTCRLRSIVDLDYHRLFVLMGKNPDSAKTIKPSLKPFNSPIPLPKEISSNLLARRPDLMASIWRLEKAAANIGVAKREFFPEIDLKGTAGLLSAVLPEQFFNISNTALSLLPSFTMPIFEGGQLQANLKEKRQDYEVAIQSYRETLLDALQQVSDALTQLTFNAKRVAAQEKIWEGSKEQESLQQKKFEEGLSNYLDLLDFEYISLNEKINVLTYQTNQALFVISLIKALGGGYESTHCIPEEILQQ